MGPTIPLKITHAKNKTFKFQHHHHTIDAFQKEWEWKY